MDILAQNVQLCARFNGGANAGHTLRLRERDTAGGIPRELGAPRVPGPTGGGIAVGVFSLF